MSCLGDDFGERGVAEQQPTARRDAVGLVLEAIRVHLVEELEPGANANRTRFTKRILTPTCRTPCCGYAIEKCRAIKLAYVSSLRICEWTAETPLVQWLATMHR